MADLSLYNDYEAEFQNLVRSIRTRISRVSQYEDNSDKANAEIRTIDSDLWQAKQQLADMENEVRGFPESTRREVGDKIRTYKNSMKELQQDLERAKNKFNRAALLGSSDMKFSDQSQSQRQRMMDVNTRLSAGTDSLQRSRQTLAETEAVAMDISTELNRNRETLHSIRGKVSEVGGMTDTARRMLRSMTKREHRFKIMLGVFIVVLITVIAVIVYYATKGKSDDKGKGDNNNNNQRILLDMTGLAMGMTRQMLRRN